MVICGCFEQPFILYSRRKVVGKVVKAKVITGKTTNRHRGTSVASMCPTFIGMTQFQLVKLIWVHMFREQLVRFRHQMMLKTWRCQSLKKRRLSFSLSSHNCF